MTTGIVYVLTNAAMPGLVKIGFTTNELKIRLRELDSTGVPLPFECFCAFEVNDHRKVEQLLHDIFCDQRVRSKREFFRISPERVRSALTLTGGKDITAAVSEVVTTPEEKEILNAARKRAPAATFDMIGIKPGAILEFSKDPSRTCKVINEKKVELDGEIMSVSGSALKVLHDLGYMWETANGWSHWTYRGKTLDEYFHTQDEEAA